MKPLPERAAAITAADSLNKAVALRADLERKAAGLTDHIAARRASHSRDVEAAIAALCEGREASPVFVLDTAQAEFERSILTSAIAAVVDRLADLRGAFELADKIAARAEAEAANATAIALLAGRGLSIELSGTAIDTSRLVATPAFQCRDMADAEALAGAVRATGLWPWGPEKALSDLHRLAKQGAQHAA